MTILETVFTRRHKVAQKRLDICKKCDKFNEKLVKCEECGCFLEYKTMFMNSECPLKKWKKSIL